MTDEIVQPNSELSATSTSLLRSAQARQADAWNRLVDQYGPFVYRICRRQGLQPACANDVLQDVFAAVARKLIDFRYEGPEATFRGWLRIITRNKLRDRARLASRTPDAEGGSHALVAWLEHAEPVSGSTSASGVPSERVRRVRLAMERVRQVISEVRWNLFCAVVIEGLAPDDAARDFQVSRNVVYLTKSQVLRRLREELTQLELTEA